MFACVTAGVLGYLCHCTFENFFQWPVMSQSMWLLLGLSTVMAAMIIRNAGEMTGRQNVEV